MYEVQQTQYPGKYNIQMFQFKAIFDEFWSKVALKVATASMHKTNRKSVATPCQTSIKSNYLLPKKKAFK